MALTFRILSLWETNTIHQDWPKNTTKRYIPQSSVRSRRWRQRGSCALPCWGSRWLRTSPGGWPALLGSRSCGLVSVGVGQGQSLEWGRASAAVRLGRSLEWDRTPVVVRHRLSLGQGLKWGNTSVFVKSLPILNCLVDYRGRASPHFSQESFLRIVAENNKTRIGP